MSLALALIGLFNDPVQPAAPDGSGSYVDGAADPGNAGQPPAPIGVADVTGAPPPPPIGSAEET